MFNKFQKNFKKDQDNIEKWRKEAINLFEAFCRDNNMAVIPELTHRDHPFGGLQGLQAGLQFYPLTDEQSKQIYPEFVYRDAKASAEAIKNGEIKIQEDEK